MVPYKGTVESTLSGFRKGQGQRFILCQGFRICSKEVHICRLGKLKLVLNTVQAGIDQQRIGNIGICQRIGRTQLCPAVLAGGGRNPNQLRAVLTGPGNLLGSFVKAQPVEGLLAGVQEYSHVRNRAENTGKHMICILFISALDGNVDMLSAARLVCQGFG